MSEPRWIKAPPGSHWGEFGPDDQRGRMNLVDERKVLQGIAEVKVGKTFCLSLPLDVPGGQTLNPRRMPPQRFSTLRDGKSAGQQGFCWSYQSEDPDLTDIVNDDVVLMNLQYSTQWDSFAHVGSHFDADDDGQAEGVFYNGFRAGEDIVAAPEDPTSRHPALRFPGPEARALDIAGLAEHGAQGRGVMIDLLRHLGPGRQAVGYDALMRILEAERIEIEAGDMVCLHTGFAERLWSMNKRPDLQALHQTTLGLNGQDERLLQWVSDTRLACLIADNPAVELPMAKLLSPHPIRQPRLPLHEHCLFKNGIHLGELWFLSDLARWLARHQRSRFLLTAPPLRLPGAVGSPATPIATV